MIEHTPRKSLGQHFLHDKRVIEQIIRHFDPRTDETVVEIGPGLGALTYELLPRAGQVHVVELDTSLAELLMQETEAHENLHVYNYDALKTDFRILTGATEIRVIGNLPYNISTPLLFHLIEQRICIRDLCIMLQKEVGVRIQAGPGSKSYGRLSVMIQQCCRTELIAEVGAGAFNPPPKVDSVVLGLVPYIDPPYPVSDPAAFEKVVRTAFSRRRKTIRNALKTLLDEQQIVDLGIDPRLRPEQLGIGDFVRLGELVSVSVTGR